MILELLTESLDTLTRYDHFEAENREKNKKVKLKQISPGSFKEKRIINYWNSDKRFSDVF